MVDKDVMDESSRVDVSEGRVVWLVDGDMVSG